MQVGKITNQTVPEDAKRPTGTNDDISNYYTASEYIEIATGSSENTRTNNIYDLAGNMWEWTTETKIRTNNSNSKDSVFAVLRGGSFYYYGSDYPVVCRSGGNTVGSTLISIGFRPVLYIN